jgi:hypothetical protein
MTDESYTARLENWGVTDKGHVFGNVYDDKKGRFEDGKFIKTTPSHVDVDMELGDLEPGSLVSTKTSIYILGEKFVPPEETEGEAE